MLYQIKHVTRFFYDRPVFCEPLTLRLRPRDDHQQRVVWQRLDIDPAPAGRAESLDLEGNRVAQAWFDETTLRLCVTANCLVEVHRENPFDFLLGETGASLPIRPSAAEVALCEYYGREPQPSAEVGALARELLAGADDRTVPFAVAAASWLATNIRCEPRPDAPARPAPDTLQLGRGACRDLAVLFNALCRAVGLPARFVSGYAFAEEAQASELHAWSEVYLPGAGWRGFDPAQGLAVAGQHVVLAAAKDPSEAAPSAGRFRGTNTRSRLESQLVMRVAVENGERVGSTQTQSNLDEPLASWS